LQPIRFLHIPKTAGTTFTQILNKQYSDVMKFQFSGDREFDINNYNSISKEQRDKIILFYGHAPIQTGIDFIDAVDTITLLREPIDRVKSFCQHVSEGKSPYLKNSFLQENVFNLDLLLDNVEIFELHNLQTKMLVNNGDCAANFVMNDMGALNKALDNLFNKIIVFGLVEYFDESLMLFEEKFSWDLPIYTKKNKRNKNKLLQFESHHIERIKKINHLDIQLYQQAQERFVEIIKNKNFDKYKLMKFKKINKYQFLLWMKYKKMIMRFAKRVYKKLLGQYYNHTS